MEIPIGIDYIRTLRRINIIDDKHISVWSRENLYPYLIALMDISHTHQVESDDDKRRQRRVIIKSLSFPENIDEATRLIRRLKVHSVDDLNALDIKLAYLQNLIEKKRKTVRKKIGDTSFMRSEDTISDKHRGGNLGKRAHDGTRVGYDQLTPYEVELVDAQEWTELDKSLRDRGMI